MPEFVIQPTKKWIRFQFTLVFLVFCVAVGVYINMLQNLTAWLLVIPALLFLWPLSGQVRRRFTKITVTGDKLRYESGMLSKTTRTVQLSKVQDVRVDQSLGQRLVSIGNLSIETAGETSRLTIEDIDDPTAVADEIMEAAQGPPEPKRKGEKA